MSVARALGRWRNPSTRMVPAALLVALAVEIGLRTTSLPRLTRALGVELAVTGHDDLARGPVGLGPADTTRYRAAAAVARRWPFGRNGQCLRLALTAGFLLRRCEPRLYLGVRHVAGRTVAHAWLAVGGAVLDPTADAWAPLVRPTAP